MVGSLLAEEIEHEHEHQYEHESQIALPPAAVACGGRQRGLLVLVLDLFW